MREQSSDGLVLHLKNSADGLQALMASVCFDRQTDKSIQGGEVSYQTGIAFHGSLDTYPRKQKMFRPFHGSSSEAYVAGKSIKQASYQFNA